MKHPTWKRIGPVGASLLLAMLDGCGDNANDVGMFDDGPATAGSGATGEVSTTDGSNASSTNAGGTGSTSGGSGGTGQGDGGTGGVGAGGTSAGGSGATDAGTDSGNSGGATNTGTGIGGGGGATGSGATGSGGTTTGNGGSGGSEACPLERPADNSPCEPDQLECPYAGECGEETLVCSQGQWARRASEARTCASFTRETFPRDGDSCTCTPELRCEFLDCDGRGRILAQCNGDTWQVEAEPCEEVRPCGPVTGEQPRCRPDQICVATAAGPGEGYTCEDNPCAEANLPNSCECARSVCPGDAFECSMRDDDTVLACTRPDCQ